MVDDDGKSALAPKISLYPCLLVHLSLLGEMLTMITSIRQTDP